MESFNAAEKKVGHTVLESGLYIQDTILIAPVGSLFCVTMISLHSTLCAISYLEGALPAYRASYTGWSVLY